jgi:2-haloacid dehalogenase
VNSLYTTLLFDADGTLLDYDVAESHSLAAAAGSFALEVTPEILEVYRRINSALWTDLEKGLIDSLTLRVRRFELLARSTGWNIEAEAFSRRYLEELGCSGFLIPGTEAMLDALPARLTKAVITNGIRDVQYGRLTRAGLANRFEHIIISEDAGAAKPSPLFFDYALERIGSRNPLEYLIIGDSLTSDIAGGAGYGIDTCWFNPGGLSNGTDIVPDYEISGWHELPSIIG